MDIKVIYEDKDLLVADKPAGIVVFPEGETTDGTLIDELIKKYPELKEAGEAPRYGVVHRLDKDTSGVLLIAKTTEALIFFQKQFKNRLVGKKYICLAEGNIKNDSGAIKTLIARAPKDKRKQKAYLPNEAPVSAREALTEYKIIGRYNSKVHNFTLLEVEIKTGRRHQIRCHFSYIHHPVAGDKMYGFKDSYTPEGLNRQFLHSALLRIQLPNGTEKEFVSDLPHDLQEVLTKLQPLCQ